MYDELKNSALDFKNLLKKRYYIVLGHKNNNIKINIMFNETNFFHLAGLHKLKDIDIDNHNKYAIFRDILNNKFTIKDISKSCYFYKIENRFTDLKNLEKYLDNCTDIFGVEPISSCTK